MQYRFADYEMDTGAFELRSESGSIELEPQVFEVLAYLIDHRERVVTKDELLDAVWPQGYGSESSLASRVKAARQAIGDSGQAQRWIRTVRGRGYRFVGEVAGASEAAVATAVSESGPASKETSVARPASLGRSRIRYCTAADGTNLAYAVAGQGPPLVKAANWLNHLEFDWESPVWRGLFTGLIEDFELIRYDVRGTGLSDRDAEGLSFERFVDDLETVVEATGAERVALLGISQGGAIAVAYALRHPERVSHLILHGAYARGWRRRENPREQEIMESLKTLLLLGWEQKNPAFRQVFASRFIPGATEEQAAWFRDLFRVSVSPQTAVKILEVVSTIDVRALLPRLQVPALVLHSREDAVAPFEEGRYLATNIAGAEFVPLESANHLLLGGEPACEIFLSEVRRFAASVSVS